MNSPIPYLDGFILASTIYPSGFSHSLYSAWKGLPRRLTTGFLAFLAFPYLVFCPVVWVLRPSLLTWRSTSGLWVLAAVLMPIIVMTVEYVIHGVAFYWTTGKIPAWFSVHQMGRKQLTVQDCALFAVVVIGEEIVYRGIGISVLRESFAFPWAISIVISSLAYGLNHLAFGGLSFVSKAAAGVFYGTLYVLGGQSILLPILAHGLQNTALFALARDNA